METILLASTSPRRQQLLEQADLPFVTIAPEVDEEAGLATDVVSRVRELACRKVQAVLGSRGDYNWVLGCDTLVEIEGQILAKAPNRTEARRMLSELSGRSHNVHTGMALYVAHVAQTRVDHATTQVYFRSLQKPEIERYLSTDEWRGVAGAYRIQGRGDTLIVGINGSYSNVVGLPLSLLCGMLSADHYPFG